MRGLANFEVAAVGGGEDAECYFDDNGVLHCEGDWINGDMSSGEYWVGGDDGAWHIFRDADGETQIEFWPMP